MKNFTSVHDISNPEILVQEANDAFSRRINTRYNDRKGLGDVDFVGKGFVETLRKGLLKSYAGAILLEDRLDVRSTKR